MNTNTFTLSADDLRERWGMSLYTIKAWRDGGDLVPGTDYIHTGHGIRYRHDIANHPKIKNFRPRSRK